MAFEETLYTHSITLEPRDAWKTLTPPIMHVLVVDLTHHCLSLLPLSNCKFIQCLLELWNAYESIEVLSSSQIHTMIIRALKSLVVRFDGESSKAMERWICRVLKFHLQGIQKDHRQRCAQNFQNGCCCSVRWLHAYNFSSSPYI